MSEISLGIEQTEDSGIVILPNPEPLCNAALKCRVCSNMCVRGVSLPCCGTQACRNCAALKVKSCKFKCWNCSSPVVMADLVNDSFLRSAVDFAKARSSVPGDLLDNIKDRLSKREAPKDVKKQDKKRIPIVFNSEEVSISRKVPDVSSSTADKRRRNPSYNRRSRKRAQDYFQEIMKIASSARGGDATPAVTTSKPPELSEKPHKDMRHRDIRHKEMEQSMRSKDVKKPHKDMRYKDISDEDDEEENSQKFFVGNLADGTTNAELQELFEPYGEVDWAQRMLDKPFGFVKVCIGDHKIDQIIKELDGRELNGNPVTVQLSTIKGPRRGRRRRRNRDQDDLDVDSCTDDPDLEEEQVDVTTQKFFVGNLAGNFQTTDEDLRELFEPYGEVSRAEVMHEKPFGFIYIDIADNQINRIIKDLDCYNLNGSYIRVQLSDQVNSSLKKKCPSDRRRDSRRCRKQPGSSGTCTPDRIPEEEEDLEETKKRICEDKVNKINERIRKRKAQDEPDNSTEVLPDEEVKKRRSRTRPRNRRRKRVNDSSGKSGHVNDSSGKSGHVNDSSSKSGHVNDSSGKSGHDSSGKSGHAPTDRSRSWSRSRPMSRSRTRSRSSSRSRSRSRGHKGSSRSRKSWSSSGRSKSRPCYYHRRYGVEALMCESPCSMGLSGSPCRTWTRSRSRSRHYKGISRDDSRSRSRSRHNKGISRDDSRSRSRGRARSSEEYYGLCIHHQRYGNKALKCEAPCTMSGQGTLEREIAELRRKAQEERMEVERLEYETLEYERLRNEDERLEHERRENERVELEIAELRRMRAEEEDILAAERAELEIASAELRLMKKEEERAKIVRDSNEQEMTLLEISQLRHKKLEWVEDMRKMRDEIKAWEKSPREWITLSGTGAVAATTQQKVRQAAEHNRRIAQLKSRHVKEDKQKKEAEPGWMKSLEALKRRTQEEASKDKDSSVAGKPSWEIEKEKYIREIAQLKKEKEKQAEEIRKAKLIGGGTTSNEVPLEIVLDDDDAAKDPAISNTKKAPPSPSSALERYRQRQDADHQRRMHIQLVEDIRKQTELNQIANSKQEVPRGKPEVYRGPFQMPAADPGDFYNAYEDPLITMEGGNDMDLTNTRNSISLIDNRNDIDLRNVRRPPSATGGRRANPELCTYHTRFGAKAMNCQPGCGWADKKRQSGLCYYHDRRGEKADKCEPPCTWPGKAGRFREFWGGASAEERARPEKPVAPHRGERPGSRTHSSLASEENPDKSYQSTKSVAENDRTGSRDVIVALSVIDAEQQKQLLHKTAGGEKGTAEAASIKSLH